MSFRRKSNVSIWKQLLESALMKKDVKSANVLVFGNPESGKKDLIDSLIEFLKQRNYIFGHLEEDEKRKNIDSVYILSYKFIRIK